MVLQADSPVKIWGWADPGDVITVTFSGQETISDVSPSGRWMVELGPFEPTSEGQPLSIHSSNESLDVQDVVVGQVWVCSGQSNMEFRLRNAQGAEQDISNADYPAIRYFSVYRHADWQVPEDANGIWHVISPRTAGKCSAVAYYFGQALYEELGQPVGLITSSVGGSPGEAWASRPALMSNPHLTRVQQQIEWILNNYPEIEENYGEMYLTWKNRYAQYVRDRDEWNTKPVSTRGPQPEIPDGVANHLQPSVLFNGMIAPLASYRVKGAIWYQGERNANGGNAYEYRYLLPTIISSWRDLWGHSEMPFYFVQLPEYKGSEAGTWPVMRESMLQTWEATPHTGMAVTIGLGSAKQIHPTDKKPVGQRLAKIALAQDYGRDVIYSGPVYDDMQVKGEKAYLSFDYLESPLAPAGQELAGFEIAGSNKQFVPARAHIEEDQVVVWSAEVKEPVAVRYAWTNIVQPSLFNQAGLPASPFRTDNWPVISQEGFSSE